MTQLEFQHVLVTNVQIADEQTKTVDGEEQTALTTSTHYIVTLALSPEQSERFVFASEFGHVWLSQEPASVSDDGTPLVAEAEPFLVAAAKAMEIDTLHQIDTGLDPVTAEREQWDDGNNTLAIAPRVAVAYERNDETNDRLEAAGIEVLRIAGSELGSGRGGPRCMSCPVSRESLA